MPEEIQGKISRTGSNLTERLEDKRVVNKITSKRYSTH